jgi:hypothetical protein
MTREDIIRMAREICDLYRGDPYDKDCGTITMYPEELERIVNRAVETEREACAKVCDDHYNPNAGLREGIWVFGTAVALAAVIRARGDA